MFVHVLRNGTPDILSLDHPIGADFSSGDSLRAPGSDDPLTYVQWMETRQMLQEAMGRLPPLFSLVMALRHQEGMSYQEIAATTGLPLGTVKSYLFRARKRLREWLADAYGWEVKNNGV